MRDIISTLIDNKEWVFSGLGVFILGIFINLLRRKSSKTKQNQKLKNSFGIQVGGNLSINEDKNERKEK